MILTREQLLHFRFSKKMAETNKIDEMTEFTSLSHSISLFLSLTLFLSRFLFLSLSLSPNLYIHKNILIHIYININKHTHTYTRTSSIAQHLKKHSCPTAHLRKILPDNTTILEKQNNKQKLQILEALHIRKMQPTLNRINFQTSANAHKCL